ncbi:hypothetical protein [Streptomyces sp. NBC_00582]|uniref:hypothetical protein n=1 Tax=Streptomyces sp. NBC_00582 TaxID=2975783 RepID=UPI002E823917|nr:hypothetical protein [Streptomyces sp. NBC_00582]WUB63898.1 hypothetical protein OG852_27630 [Streptomyces sp. NBC_00582]
MRAAVRRLTLRLGRRGALLTLKGTIAVLYGYGQIISPLNDRRGLCLLLKAWPLTVWAGLWITAGAVALVCAWLPPRRDWPGFLAVWGITAPWSMAYLVAWWPLDEYPRGWVPAAIFGAFGAVCLVAIGWEEAPRARSESRSES